MDRFYSKVKIDPETGCWEWNASRTKQGYGKIGAGGKGNGWVPAHRLSYELHNGPIPRGMFVCHTCDNPGCVNPKHLWLGTQSDNMVDCVRKKRHFSYFKDNPMAGGPSHPLAKLTTAQVLEIRKANGRHVDIAAQYGITRRTVGKIKSGERRRHG